MLDVATMLSMLAEAAADNPDHQVRMCAIQVHIQISATAQDSHIWSFIFLLCEQ